MKICYNGLVMNQCMTGTGYYAFHLLKNMLKLDTKNEYEVFVQDPDILKTLTADNLQVHKVPSGSIRKFWYEHVKLSSLAKDCDVFMAPYFYVPIGMRCKTVVTIHDLFYRSIPESIPLFRRWIYAGLMGRAIKKADNIIAVSQATSQDIRRYYGKNTQQKTRVIYEAAKFSTKIESDENIYARVQQRYQLPDKFILYVGRLEFRKNIKMLIDAFSQVAAKYPQLYLLLAGSPGYRYSEIETAIEKSPFRARIVRPNYIQEQDLPIVYQLAQMFAFPSLYEGFGLPILEAMSQGVPVISSNVSSLPEVAGDAALLVSPHNTNAWATAIQSLQDDSALRNKLILKGSKRVEIFSWKKAAIETLAFISEQ